MQGVQGEWPFRASDIAARCDSGGVAWIALNRPPANFLDVELAEAILSAIAWAHERNARAIVLFSEVKHFCAGANLAARGQKLDSRLYDTGTRIFDSPVPIVAAVHGAAVGGGLGLALAADLRVATADTRFAANFARLGFHHGFGLTVTLPEAVGSQHARDLLYTGRSIFGEEAFQIGLCDRLASRDQLLACAESLARELAEAAPLAVSAIRATMRAGIGDRVRAVARHELDQQQKLAATEDFREGIRASRDRRAPRFTGR